MELILINDSKLKVMLTPADMESYAITCDTIDYENTETRRAFWNILDEAKHKTGFDAASDKVFIQVYPSKNGGCELYVTKLLHNDYGGNITVKRNDSTVTAVYEFENINSLLAVCRQLAVVGYIGDSSAFSDSNKSYYLSITERKDTYSFITEFGERRNTGFLDAYLAEHCVCICEGNAVGVLSKL
jgi:Negative regulator of genetic competence, sporulation and motility